MTNLSSLDYLENFTISKTINDSMWKLSATLDKNDAPSAMIGVRAFATDYADVEHCLFVGFIPGSEFIRESAKDKVHINAFDFSWYLSAQHVPLEFGEVALDGVTQDYDIIEALLGGEDSLNITGLAWGGEEEECTNYGTFVWNVKTTKQKAITDLADNCNKYFFVVFEDIGGGVYQPTAYYAYSIEDYVPAMVTITNPDDYLIDYHIVENTSEKFNRVVVYGTNPETGEWYTATEETPEVTAGEEKPIEYVYQDAKLTSQAKVNAKALSLYANLYEAEPAVYSATFIKRFDFRLMQKIFFSGYTDIPEEQMRIVGITYNLALNQDIVKIEFVENQSFTMSRIRNKFLTNDIITNQKIITDKVINDEVPNLAIGTVTAIAGNVATVELERSGNTVRARILD